MSGFNINSGDLSYSINSNDTSKALNNKLENDGKINLSIFSKQELSKSEPFKLEFVDETKESEKTESKKTDDTKSNTKETQKESFAEDIQLKWRSKDLALILLKMQNLDKMPKNVPFSERLKEARNKEEHETIDLSNYSRAEIETIKWAYGVDSVEELQKILNKEKVENDKKNKLLQNTKASNGMTYPEAKRVYMELYDKYIKMCKVNVPWVLSVDSSDYRGDFIGGRVDDIDPSLLESKMTVEHRKLFNEAKAAIAELSQNKELMAAYKGSTTQRLESTFDSGRSFEGLHVRIWNDAAREMGVDPRKEVIENPPFWGVSDKFKE